MNLTVQFPFGRWVLVIALFVFTMTHGHSQNQNGDPRLYSFKQSPETELSEKDSGKVKMDDRLLNHYSYDELLMLKTSSPDKFSSIESYFTQSYYFLYTSDTVELKNTFLDPATFDISKYEHLRKENEEEVIHFSKYGVSLILLPKKQLSNSNKKEK